MAGSAAAMRNTAGRLLDMFRTMLVIREFEETAHRLHQAGLMRGPLHSSVGQEAVAVGVCANLRRTDLVQSNHRGHGHAIAKGTPVLAMLKELLGRTGGVNGGKGGSMHIADFSVGMMGANGILADGMTLAVGAAQAVDLRQSGDIVTVFVGDGTTNRGPFYEALNWAKVFRLPLLIVCEDNAYASSTVTDEVTAGGGPLARARAFDIDGTTVDGNDLEALDAAAMRLVAEARAGGGPRFLHARTYRLGGHISVDKMIYRPAEETERHWTNEPIARLERRLLELGIPEATTTNIRAEVGADLAAAAREAQRAPFPDAARAYEDILDVGGSRWK